MKLSKKAKIARMVVGDLLLLGAALCVFSYFHHVRVKPPQPQQISKPHASVSENTATPAPTQDAEPSKGPEMPAETPEPTGLLMGQYADKFSKATIQEEQGYRSENVSVELLTEEMYDSIVHIADIYVKDITSLRTAVYNDYSKKYMHTLDMANAAGAIVAISGDHFYAHIQAGVFAIRNGQLYAEKPNKKQDACILYYDGAMEVYKADEIDLDAIYARDPYQLWYFGPGLLDEDGSAIQEFKSTVRGENPRSAIGYYEPGHYCFVMVEGRTKDSNGVTLPQLAQIFEDLGCKTAYNLDGGKTSVMTYNGKLVSKLIGSGREVSDIVYIAEPIGKTDAAAQE